MNVRIVKVDLEPIERQLERIADMLERLIYATNPPDQTFDPLPDLPDMRAFYSDDEQEIVEHQVTKRGYRYREPKK